MNFGMVCILGSFEDRGLLFFVCLDFCLLVNCLVCFVLCLFWVGGSVCMGCWGGVVFFVFVKVYFLILFSMNFVVSVCGEVCLCLGGLGLLGFFGEFFYVCFCLMVCNFDFVYCFIVFFSVYLFLFMLIYFC